MVEIIARNAKAQSRIVHSLQKTFWVGSVAIFCLFSQKSLLQELTSGNENSSFEQKTVELQSKNSKLNVLAKSPTFGLDNVLANYVFLDFLQYFGDERAREELGYGLTTSFFEAILTYTPDYRQFYFFLSGSGSLYAAQPQETTRLIERGLKKISPSQPNDSYYIWRYKGVDELLFLGDGEAAQQSFAIAALWAEQSDHPNSDAMEKASRQTAQYLALNPQSESVQVQAWSSVLANALNEETQRQAIEQIKELGGEVTISDDGKIRVELSSDRSS